MKAIIKGITLCGLIVLIAYSCEKEKSGTIELLVELVNKNNEVIDSFEQGDSVVFKFYLINNTVKEISYNSPCPGVIDFLKFYNEIDNEEYQYLGNPEIYCLTIGTSENIKSGETKMIYLIPISGPKWPEMKPGNYYVGDTLNLSIDSEIHQFESRIYFTIK